MISYDPGTWSILFAFSLKGSVFPKGFVWAAPCSVVSVVLHRIVSDNPTIFKQVGAGDVGASVLTGFTFILGFLVVFRSQQAYARWWEGGTLLQQLRGEWFNAYSSLLAFCNTSPDKHEEVLAFQHRLARLCSLLYCTAIQQVSTMKEKNYELIDLEDFDSESMKYMMESHDKCEICLQWIQRLIGDADEKKILKVAPPILSRVFNQLGNGIVNLNNARKITEFPIPFPLAQMITFMLAFHWIITAFVCAASVERSFWAGILSFIVTFSFWSINYIAVELEQPFGDDPNDLPLHEMQADLNKSLIALLHPCAQHAPDFHFKKEEHIVCRRSTDHIEEINFKYNSSFRSEKSTEEQEPVALEQVLLPQEVCAVPMKEPQFAAETPPRTQTPIVGTTCWSAGAAVATGAASSFKSMTSRTAPETNGQQASGLLDHTVVYGARTEIPDIQGSGVAPVATVADAVHSQAPPGIHVDAEVITERPASPTRIGILQEAPFASHQWEKRTGPLSQSSTTTLLSTSDSQVTATTTPMVAPTVGAYGPGRLMRLKW
mmetsp:Transcript_104384/g.207301  ORF Transcript_104384/g.207301 Transcript_104384/m.207301 type:complete len:547 (-) Transcript_104384:142-1782(-)